MVDTYVRFVCPSYDKKWEPSPGDLPKHTRQSDCPDWEERRRLAEFVRTRRDLGTLKPLE